MKKFHFRAAVLILAFLASHGSLALAQDSIAPPQSQSVTTLGESLKRPGNKQLHIFYVHGMAADGPGYSESLPLRKSICKYLKHCVSPEGEKESWEYADRGSFALGKQPPSLSYRGEPIWQSRIGGSPTEGWNASAPFVVHWKLARNDGAPPIYVDEINWWPLVFAVKCRQMIAKDAGLIGPGAAYLDRCSNLDPDTSPGNEGRFLSYPWIEKEDAAKLEGMPAKGALFNRGVKNALLDWGFTDAVLSVSQMRSLLLEGIRELVLKSVNVDSNGNRAGSTGPYPNQEFIIISHSLGSYLILSALDYKLPDPDSASNQPWKLSFEKVMNQTSRVYFFANQIRLLDLANLEPSAGENMIDHLKAWRQYRCQFLLSHTDGPPPDSIPPQIVAWNDPSDLLSWTVPELNKDLNDLVVNLPVKNSIHWFWLIEDPIAAHENYATNHHVISAMLKPPKSNPATVENSCNSSPSPPSSQ